MWFKNWLRNKIPIGKLVLEIPTDMAWCFDKGEYYEKNVIYWFEKISNGFTRPVIYDIGANYGFFSIKFASLANLTYAFEPVSKTYSVLSKNIHRNRLGNVIPYKYGLSNKEESIEINLYSSSGNNSIFRRQLPHGHSLKFKGTEKINLFALDDLIIKENLLPPDIVKMDIEGAELYALQGAKNTISRYKPIIFMEFAETTSRDAGYTCVELIQEITQYGYEVLGLSEEATNMNLYSYSTFSKNHIANIIAFPIGFDLTRTTENGIGIVA
jgi:FkbM family methyltransferase